MMRIYNDTNFTNLCSILDHDFQGMKASPVEVGEWQSQDVSHDTNMVCIELQDTTVVVQPAFALEDLQQQIKPNLPWAEEHFLERVSGYPHNPPPSHERWPFARASNAEHTNATGEFSHTYPERFWPKHPRYWHDSSLEQGVVPGARLGIRYPYGDLDDLVQKMVESPLTRQAYLPVWFPEDTGMSRHRVPCTLGYHFMLRPHQGGLKLGCNYYIRSCDYMRHFRDDVYMACRLMQWIRLEMFGRGFIPDIFLGDMNMVISSFHVFAGDLPILKNRTKS